MTNPTIATGFSLRNAASYIFRQFDESFKATETTYKDEPKGWVGSIDIQAEDCAERVMTVSATVEYNVGLGKGKESHYKCNFTIKEEHHQIAVGAFRTRTVSIKAADLKDKEKVISKIKEYRSELSKLLAEGKAEQAQNKIDAEKNLGLIATEIEKIKAGLGDALTDITTSTYASRDTVSVKMEMANGERVYTSFDGTEFSINLMDKHRQMTTDKLVVLLGVIYL